MHAMACTRNSPNGVGLDAHVFVWPLLQCDVTFRDDVVFTFFRSMGRFKQKVALRTCMFDISFDISTLQVILVPK